MTVSFADQFDIPQFSKKYSVILKRLRSCSATCKSLCVICLTEIRVVIFTTLKMPKVLIVSVIRAACPGGSKPPPSLGVRLKPLPHDWLSHIAKMLKSCISPVQN